MNYLILFIGLTIGSICSAQEPVAAIEISEHNLLYRGYPNKIVAAVTNNEGKKVRLIGSNVTIEKYNDLDNSNTYIVNPGQGRSASLSILLVDSLSIDTIRTIKYRVLNLPDPVMYWGGVKNGHKGNIRTKVFFAKYPPEIPLNAKFRVVSWEVAFEGDTISGEGSNISSAEELLKKIPSGTTLTFEFAIVGPDGIIRIKKGQWKVIAWDEEKEEKFTKYINCG